MPYCVYCKNISDFQKGISIHVFPKDKNQRQLWIQNMGCLNWTPNRSAGLCSNHFEKNCIDKRDHNCRLRRGSIPTLFNNNNDNTASKLESRSPVQLEKFIDSEDVPVPEKMRKIEEVPVQIFSLNARLKAYHHDHTYMLTTEVAMRQVSAAKEKIQKLSLVNRKIMQKQIRDKINVSKLKEAIKYLNNLKQHPEGWFNVDSFGDTACELIKRISNNIDSFNTFSGHVLLRNCIYISQY